MLRSNQILTEAMVAVRGSRPDETLRIKPGHPSGTAAMSACGYFDHKTCRLEPIENPFGPKVLGPGSDVAVALAKPLAKRAPHSAVVSERLRNRHQ